MRERERERERERKKTKKNMLILSVFPPFEFQMLQNIESKPKFNCISEIKLHLSMALGHWWLSVLGGWAQHEAKEAEGFLEKGEERKNRQSKQWHKLKLHIHRLSSTRRLRSHTHTHTLDLLTDIWR